MAQLLMDVDSVRSTQANIMNVKGQLNDQVTALNSAVDGMVPSSWNAPGAEQFKSEFQQWRNTMMQALDQLEQLANRLQAEAQEWENTAQNVA